jgi:hypothetical protein
MPPTGQYMIIGLSPQSLIVHAALEALDTKPEKHPEPLCDNENDTLPPTYSKPERALITPSAIRFLLARYDSCIRPRYAIPLPDFTSDDSTKLTKLPNMRLFQVLIACAIAAARESYTKPDWKIIAYICREWADELLKPIISYRDGEAFQAITLLLVYELADPSRGIIWDLLDLSIRTCLQLGWHRNAQLFARANTTPLEIPVEHQESNIQSAQYHLLQVLKDVDW